MSDLLSLPDLAALSRAAAERFVARAHAATTARGRFTVALAGGSTPRALYQLLAADEFRPQVDWRRVYIFWGDERTVPPDDPQSNYRLARETLLAHVPVPPANVHRIHGEEEPEIAAWDYERALREFFGNRPPRLDLILLGLGADAHTASLFPHSAALHETTRGCVAVWVPELATHRITLTAPAINNAAHVIFVVAGSDKANALRAVLREPFEPERLPAQLIQPADGKLLWLVDAAAASGL